MKCYKHEGLDASASCQACGRAMCGECTKRFTLMMCEGCIIENNNVVKNRLIRGFVVSGLFFVLGIVLGVMNDYGIGQTVVMGYGLFGAYWSYQLLSKFIQGGMPMPLLKGILALFTGMFVAPFKVFFDIRELNRINELKTEINN
jgi:hypothetical protein